jgi:hypothetical protein
VQPLLTAARSLAAELPPGEEQKELLERIDHCQQMTGAAGFLHGMGPLSEIFEQFFDGGPYGEFDSDEGDVF